MPRLSKPENTSDVHYEKQRFSRNYLKEAAEYFEKKHGFSVWNPMVNNWVEQRISDLKLDENKKFKSKNVNRKKKIALVIDRRGWALDNVATEIVKNLSDEFDFMKIYLSDFDNLGKVLLLADDCQMIHFLWRPLASCYYNSYTQNYIKSSFKSLILCSTQLLTIGFHTEKPCFFSKYSAASFK